jgi:hypothetical protein
LRFWIYGPNLSSSRVFKARRAISASDEQLPRLVSKKRAKLAFMNMLKTPGAGTKEFQIETLVVIFRELAAKATLPQGSIATGSHKNASINSI